MELSMREKELLIMFGSERRLDTHKRLQNAIPYMTDSLYKASATALWNKLYNNIKGIAFRVNNIERLRNNLSFLWLNRSQKPYRNEQGQSFCRRNGEPYSCQTKYTRKHSQK